VYGGASGKRKAEKVDEGIYYELGLSATRQTLTETSIVDRCVFLMINGAARILADGVVGRPGDVDLGMIMGTGFPPFRGGLLRYADSVGLAAILSRLEELTREHGPRFQPADLLREHVHRGLGFYS
jgi:3-hydroxyacyl-CoA dehydrogenase/enoyl-CoA hydratase/3-hydroxybutyryl-CoA epimerase